MRLDAQLSKKKKFFLVCRFQESKKRMGKSQIEDLKEGRQSALLFPTFFSLSFKRTAPRKKLGTAVNSKTVYYLPLAAPWTFPVFFLERESFCYKLFILDLISFDFFFQNKSLRAWAKWLILEKKKLLKKPVQKSF